MRQVDTRDKYSWERTKSYRLERQPHRELVDDTVINALRYYEHVLQYDSACTKDDSDWRRELARSAAARGLQLRLLEEGILL